MSEEANHCELSPETQVKQTISVQESFSDNPSENSVDLSLKHRPQALLIEDHYIDSNADVESNADSEREDSSAHPIFSDIYGEESKAKLLGSPLSALTFPPPPPVEDADFVDAVNGVSIDSDLYLFGDLDLSKTVDRIVRAAIHEAVLVETIVSMAMNDAVESIISLIHQLQQQESENSTNEAEIKLRSADEAKAKESVSVSDQYFNYDCCLMPFDS